MAVKKSKNSKAKKIAPSKKGKVFGKLRGTVHFKGDIISPIDIAWNKKGSFLSLEKS